MSEMGVAFREAAPDDVPAVVAMLQDDYLGAGREGAPLATYVAALEEMRATGCNMLIVGEACARLVATYHFTIIPGLTLGATRRAQVEGVRVASDLRGQGVGAKMVADMEARARAAGCGMLQLAMNKTRTDTRRFYERCGFVASHDGFKLLLEDEAL